MSSDILTVSTYSYILVVIIYGVLVIIAYSCAFADIVCYGVIIV
jgi:hypothetical protein